MVPTGPKGVHHRRVKRDLEISLSPSATRMPLLTVLSGPNAHGPRGLEAGPPLDAQSALRRRGFGGQVRTLHSAFD
jgi:hypothetical protein